MLSVMFSLRTIAENWSQSITIICATIDSTNNYMDHEIISKITDTGTKIKTASYSILR